MALFDIIKADLKTAMKSHDDELKTVLRSVLAVIDNARIDGKNVNDDNVIIAIISKAVKERETNAVEYERIVNGEITADKDAVERARAHALIERNEADVLRKYLPASASQEQIDSIVDIAIKETGASTIRDMGTVMKTVREIIRTDDYKNLLVDMSAVSRTVKARLA